MSDATPRTAAATAAAAHRAAERATEDPAKLARAARVFRVALARGLVDRDGNVIDHQQRARDRAADDGVSS